MSIWLVIANPYAYDKAMWKAVSATQEHQEPASRSYVSTGLLGAEVGGSPGLGRWSGCLRSERYPQSGPQRTPKQAKQAQHNTTQRDTQQAFERHLNDLLAHSFYY